jgi:hypothetical protein
MAHCLVHKQQKMRCSPAEVELTAMVTTYMHARLHEGQHVKWHTITCMHTQAADGCPGVLQYSGTCNNPMATHAGNDLQNACQHSVHTELTEQTTQHVTSTVLVFWWAPPQDKADRHAKLLHAPNRLPCQDPFCSEYTSPSPPSQ